MINKTFSYFLFLVIVILLSFNTIADDSSPSCFGALHVVQVQGVKQSFSGRWDKMSAVSERKE